MSEDLTPRPQDPYGIAKYAVELDLEAAYQQFGLNYVIFRPHNVYGERQNIGDRYRNVIGIFMNQLLSGKPMTIFGDGEQTRAFSYIADVAPYIAKSALDPRYYLQTFNIGSDEVVTLNELAHIVAESFSAEPVVQYLPARNEVKNAHATHKKLAEYFDVNKPTPLREGIARMAAWAKEKDARQSNWFQDIEIPFGLPASWAHNEDVSNHS